MKKRIRCFRPLSLLLSLLLLLGAFPFSAHAVSEIPAEEIGTEATPTPQEESTEPTPPSLTASPFPREKRQAASAN